jgi:hypothetical protein
MTASETNNISALVLQARHFHPVAECLNHREAQPRYLDFRQSVSKSGNRAKSLRVDPCVPTAGPAAPIARLERKPKIKTGIIWLCIGDVTASLWIYKH